MAEPSLPVSQEGKPAIPDWAQILIWCGGLLLLLIIGFVVAMALRSDAEVSAFGKVATLLLVGLAAFIGLMGVLSFTSNYIGIIDAKQPFGLPEGTVRAILTIAFIVLVGVLSGYLVTNSNGRSAFSTNTRIVLQSYDLERVAIDAADTTRRSFANGRVSYGSTKC